MRGGGGGSGEGRVCVCVWGGGGGGELFAGCKLIGTSAPNQCQIITFLTLKTDNIAKLRTELKSILLEIPSNKEKVHILNWYICDLAFTGSHIDVEGKCGWIMGGWETAKGMLPPPPPPKLSGGGGGA